MGGRRRGAGSKKKASSPSRTHGSAGKPSENAEGSADETKFLELSLPEVLGAIDSLYVDQLKPFGRILRKRVAERSVSIGTDTQQLAAYADLPEVDIALLRSLCEGCPLLSVRPEEGGDWSAVFIDRTPAFMDVYCPLDIYPVEMWEEAAVYFGNLSEEEMTLPGGRYSCAQALLARNLPFLQGRTLGQVCHIVQLCISQKKLLGYLNGAVVPYGRSQSMVKEQCAVYQQPCSHPMHGPHGLPMATWDAARQCLQEILANAATHAATGAPGMVPLSNMKRLFRSRYHLELSETSLGHSKLSELLQDFRLHDVCTVQLHGHGYMVVQVQPQASAPRSRGQTITLADKLFPSEPGTAETSSYFSTAAKEPLVLSEALAEPNPCGFSLDEPLSLQETGLYIDYQTAECNNENTRWPALSPSTLSKEGTVGRFVQNTFIHANPPPPTPLLAQRRRAQSLPKDMGSDKSAWEATCHALSYRGGAVPMQGTDDVGADLQGSVSTADTASGAAPGSQTGSAPSSPNAPGSAADFSVPRLSVCSQPERQAQFVWPETPLWPPTPVTHNKADTSKYPTSWPPASLEPAGVNMGFNLNREARFLAPPALEPVGPWEGVRLSLLEPRAPADEQESENTSRQLEFCKDDPLILEDTGRLIQEWTSASKKPGQAVLSSKGALNKMVQNTFIHAAVPPSTPLPGTHQRSRSVPKDAGSGRRLSTDEASFRSPAPSPQASPAFPRVPPSPALTASPVYCWPSSRFDMPQRILHLEDMI